MTSTSLRIGGVLVGLVFAAALLSLAWTPYPTADIDIAAKLRGPSAAHWLGTDSLGRDIVSLLIVGARNALLVGVIAAAIGIFNIPVFARITRGAARAVWSRDYVLASRACGKGAWHITWRHVLPNIAGALIVQATIQFATAILAEAALSYLGLGTQPPQPSWGRMLNEAQGLMFQAPLLALWPGLAIAFSVLGLNLLGDGLRDRLDPRLARAG